MANTIALSRTINFVQTFTYTRPLTGVGGFAGEPALSIGDWVRNFILSPPFAWRWNRATDSFPITAGTQDYARALATFGWLEKGILSNAAGLVKELEIRMGLGDDTTQNEPTHIAAQLDDGAGNITVRVFPAPDQAYTVKLIFQRASPVFAATTDFWAPIPDYLSYLYNQGFLAKAYEQVDDERFALAHQWFTRLVIAANAGLTDSQINLFMQEKINLARDPAAQMGHSNIGRAGRGMAQG